MKNFGKRLESALKKQSMTQHALATAIGVTDSEVSRYISGERTPNALNLIRIAKTLNTTAEELLGG